MTDDTTPLPGPGHNRGPELEPVSRLTLYRWRTAQKSLKRPSDMALRAQVRRAKELGMPPADYMSVRNFAGRDLAAMAFTPEALQLRLGRRLSLPEPVQERLAAIRDCKLLCFCPDDEPADPFREELSEAAGVAFSASAPLPRQPLPWQAARAAIRALLDPDRLTGASVLLWGQGTVAEQLYQAGRLGGMLPPQRFAA